MAKKLNHTHRLRKHIYKGTKHSIFFCSLPDCHFKIDAPLAIGKRSLCNVCGVEFIMNEYSLKLFKPHCGDCGKVRVKDAEGKDRFIRKASGKLLAGAAGDTSKDLRSRLNDAVNIELEEDI